MKSGHVRPEHIRDLHGVVDREKAAIGVFITLDPPTPDMVKEAVSAGFYKSISWEGNYPKIQIITIEDLLSGREIKMHQDSGTFKQTQKVIKPEGDQWELGIRKFVIKLDF